MKLYPLFFVFTAISLQGKSLSALREDLTRSCSEYGEFANRFLIGALQGAAMRATVYGIKTVTQPVDANSVLADVGTGLFAIGTGLMVGDAIGISVVWAEEKMGLVKEVEKKVDEKKKDELELRDFFSIAGHLTGVGIVNGLLPQADAKQ